MAERDVQAAAGVDHAKISEERGREITRLKRKLDVIDGAYRTLWSEYSALYRALGKLMKEHPRAEPVPPWELHRRSQP